MRPCEKTSELQGCGGSRKAEEKVKNSRMQNLWRLKFPLLQMNTASEQKVGDEDLKMAAACNSLPNYTAQVAVELIGS